LTRWRSCCCNWVCAWWRRFSWGLHRAAGTYTYKTKFNLTFRPTGSQSIRAMYWKCFYCNYKRTFLWFSVLVRCVLYRENVLFRFWTRLINMILRCKYLGSYAQQLLNLAESYCSLWRHQQQLNSPVDCRNEQGCGTLSKNTDCFLCISKITKKYSS